MWTVYDSSHSFQRSKDASIELLAWLKHSFVEAPEGMVAIDAMYDTYLQRFCHPTHTEPHLKSEFGKYVHKAFPHIKIRRRGPLGSQVSHYAGIQERIAQSNKTSKPESSNTESKTSTLPDRSSCSEVKNSPATKRKTTRPSTKALASKTRSQNPSQHTVTTTIRNTTTSTQRKRESEKVGSNKTKPCQAAKGSKAECYSIGLAEEYFNKKRKRGVYPAGIPSLNGKETILFQEERAQIKKFKYFDQSAQSRLGQSPCVVTEDPPLGFFLKSLPMTPQDTPLPATCTFFTATTTTTQQQQQHEPYHYDIMYTARPFPPTSVTPMTEEDHEALLEQQQHHAQMTLAFFMSSILYP